MRHLIGLTEVERRCDATTRSVFTAHPLRPDLGHALWASMKTDLMASIPRAQETPPDIAVFANGRI